MMPLQLSQIARWTESRLIGNDLAISSVSTDSRKPMQGALFIAIKGDQFDGHDFTRQAEESGAVALLVSRQVESSLPQILCADTQEALGEIAAQVHRLRSTINLALTGSNGKTSVKAFLLEILSTQGQAYANPGNFNNEIGLPLSVLSADEDAKYSIFEMGAGKPGDIAYLCSIVTPDVALVNNVAPAHLERLGDLMGVAQTKGAIYEALSDDGVAVVNADDAFCGYFTQRIGQRRMLRFGIENNADIFASHLSFGEETTKFKLHTPIGDAELQLQFSGRHCVMNAMAAASMAIAVGADLECVVAGLENCRPIKGRQVVHWLSSGSVLVDDSYNANPASVAAAIASLALAKKDRVLVLGDMAELGEQAEELHSDIGQLAAKSGIQTLYTVGVLSAAASRSFGSGARHFSDQTALVAALSELLKSPVHCLVKGSRSSAMDRVVTQLLKNLGLEGEHRVA